MFKKLIRWLRSLLSEDYLIELAEMYLASQKISPEDAAMINLMLEELRREDLEKVVKRNIRKKLRKLLADYLAD